MITIYRKTLLAGFIGLGALALAAQDPQPLLRTLVENTTDTYKITSKIDNQVVSPQLGTQPLKITSGVTYTVKTAKVDASKGMADVEVTRKFDTLDPGDGMLAQFIQQGKLPAPTVQEGTIDKYGHLVLKATTAGTNAAAILLGATDAMQGSMLVELPNHAVKVGDSWDIVVPKGAMSDSDQKISVKLTGDDKVDGHDVWKVDVSGTININFDSATLNADAPANPNNTLANLHIIGKGSTTITGTGTIDKATGKTMNLSSTGTVKLALELPDAGDVTGEVTGTTSSELKLQS